MAGWTVTGRRSRAWNGLLAGGVGSVTRAGSEAERVEWQRASAVQGALLGGWFAAGRGRCETGSPCYRAFSWREASSAYARRTEPNGCCATVVLLLVANGEQSNKS